MRRTPALIVGGGPAGAALAIELARARLPHLLLERTRETGDALCGGFLSWRTLAQLDRLGIAAAALNPVPIARLRLFARGATVEAPLPAAALAVSRRRLDTLMLAQAGRLGARIDRGVAVRSIDHQVARLGDGASIDADTLFLASGKHDTRGVARPPWRGGDPVLGLRVRLAAGPTLDRLVGSAIELHLFDRGYAGLVRQEDGSGNLCLAVRRSRLREAGDPERLLRALGGELPALGDRLALRLSDAAADAIANVPYGWRAASTSHGLFRLGDQAAVIPSLAGEGIGIALASARAAAEAFRCGGAAAAASYQRRLAHRARRPLAVAGVAWHMTERPIIATVLVRLAGTAKPFLSLLARQTRIAPSSISAGDGAGS